MASLTLLGRADRGDESLGTHPSSTVVEDGPAEVPFASGRVVEAARAEIGRREFIPDAHSNAEVAEADDGRGQPPPPEDGYTVFGWLRGEDGEVLTDLETVVWALDGESEDRMGAVRPDGSYVLLTPAAGPLSLYVKAFGWSCRAERVLLDREQRVRVDLVLSPLRSVLCRLVTPSGAPLWDDPSWDPVRFHVAPTPLPGSWSDPWRWWRYNIDRLVLPQVSAEDRAQGKLCILSLAEPMPAALTLFHRKQQIAEVPIYADTREAVFVVEPTPDDLIGTVIVRLLDAGTSEEIVKGALLIERGRGLQRVKGSPDGSWRLEDQPAGEMIVTFTGAVHGWSHFPVHVQGGRTVETVIPIGPFRRISGRMVFPDGAPAPDATAVVMNRHARQIFAAFGFGTETDGSFAGFVDAGVHDLDIECESHRAYVRIDTREQDHEGLVIELHPTVKVTLLPNAELKDLSFRVRTNADAIVLSTRFFTDRYGLELPPGRYRIELMNKDRTVRASKEFDVGSVPFDLPIGG